MNLREGTNDIGTSQVYPSSSSCSVTGAHIPTQTSGDVTDKEGIHDQGWVRQEDEEREGGLQQMRTKMSSWETHSVGEGEKEKKKHRQQKKVENKAEPNALNTNRCLILHTHSFRKRYLPSTCLEPGIILAYSTKKPPVSTIKRELLCMALRGECRGRMAELPSFSLESSSSAKPLSQKFHML